MAKWCGLCFLALAAGVLAARRAPAAPVLRVQVDQRGGFVLFGNTLARDCAPGVPTPVVGAVGECGASTGDTGPDVFWRADDPAPGQATASTAIAPQDARSTAVLSLPQGATVSHARLYWAALLPTGVTAADEAASLERPGVFSAAATADVRIVTAKPGEPDVRWYQSSADVTAVVQALGSGPYRVGDVLSAPLAGVDSPDNFAAWAVVVFYRRDSDPPHNLALFDGLDVVDRDNPVRATLQGLLVPNAGFDGRLGVVAYEGDATLTGDSLVFGGTPLGDRQNPENNFFNGTRSLLGDAVSVAGDLPQLLGTPRSMGGVDFDVVDVTPILRPRDTSASIEATSGGDTYLLGVFVTSIATLKPDFRSSRKSAVDLNGELVRPGDVVEFTIAVENSGFDTSENTVVRDALPAGVTYMAGTLEIVSGAGAGPKTDVAGDDQGEYDAATRTVVFRVGQGASATRGGRLAPGESTTLRFRVTVDATATGTLLNQAMVTAEGARGAPSESFPTDGDPVTPGAQPTPLPVGGCRSNSDCVPPTPICDATAGVCVACLASPGCGGTTPVCDPQTGTCGPCLGDGPPDCPDPARPACQRTGLLAGACTECSATNTSRCGGVRPLCLVDLGLCGCTDADGDSECGGPSSGIVCSARAGICIAGCSVAPGRNGCPSPLTCSNQTGGVGTCIGPPCLRNEDCTVASLLRCDTRTTPGVCVQCLADADCASPLVCDELVARRCLECTPAKLAACSAAGAGAACLADGTCGCHSDLDCGPANAGRVCDPATARCTIGCRGTGGARCPVGATCTSSGPEIGRCVPTGGICPSGSDGTPCGQDGICVSGACRRIQITGAACTCASGGGPGGVGWLALLLFAAWRRARRRR